MPSKRARLTDRIKAEKKRLSKQTLKSRASDWVRDLYYPSAVSLSIVGILIVIAYALIRCNSWHADQNEIVRIARLQPIGVGIALIFVPITVFAIGLSSRKTPSGVSAAEVLLRETYLFPIAILVIGLLVTLAAVATTKAAVTVILVTFGLAVFTLYRLVQVVLDGHRQYRSGIAILEDKIRRSIDLAVTERIGKNLMLRDLQDLPLEYSPFSADADTDQFFYVRHSKQGTVEDILLDKLGQFASELERLANENNCAYTEKRIPRSTPSVLGDIYRSEYSLRTISKR